MSERKHRGRYGNMGNQLNVSTDNAFTTFSGDRTTSYYDISGSNNSIVEGFRRNRVGNPDAKWEKKITTNIGIDTTLFSGKLELKAEYYRQEDDDLIYNTALQGTTCRVKAHLINISTITNKRMRQEATTY